MATFADFDDAVVVGVLALGGKVARPSPTLRKIRRAAFDGGLIEQTVFVGGRGPCALLTSP